MSARTKIKIRLRGCWRFRSKKRQEQLDRLFAQSLRNELRADYIRTRIADVLRDPVRKKGRRG
jgi:hypothetical protein